MSPLVSVAVVCYAVVCANDATEWNMRRAMHERIADIEFIFEVESGPLKGNDWESPDQIHRTKGKFRYHRDGVLYLESYKPNEGGTMIERMSMRKGGNYRVRYDFPDPRHPPEQQTRRALASDCYDAVESPVTAWPIPFFEFNSRKLESDIEFLGSEQVDGFMCAKFALSDGKVFRRVYWLDEQRGGNVLKFECYVNGKLDHRTRDVQLVELVDSKGQRHWMPASLVCDGFRKIDPASIASGRVEFSKTATYRTVYRFLRHTMKINVGIPADSLEVRFDPRHVVFDRDLHPSQRGEGTPLIQGPKVTPAEVREALKQADIEVGQLLQQARRREIDWVLVASIACAVLGVVGLVVLWYLRQRDAST